MAKLGNWWKERKSKPRASKPDSTLKAVENEETKASTSPQPPTVVSSEPNIKKLENVPSPDSSDKAGISRIPDLETPERSGKISQRKNVVVHSILEGTCSQEIIIGGGASPPPDNSQNTSGALSGGRLIVPSPVTNRTITSQDPRSPPMQWISMPTPPIIKNIPSRPKTPPKQMPPKSRVPLSIYSLPKEILHDIASSRYLDNLSIISLKRTCKTMAKMSAGRPIPPILNDQKPKEPLAPVRKPRYRLYIPPVVKKEQPKPDPPPLAKVANDHREMGSQSTIRKPRYKLYIPPVTKKEDSKPDLLPYTKKDVPNESPPPKIPPPLIPPPHKEPLEDGIILNFVRPTVQKPIPPPLQLPPECKPIQHRPSTPPPVIQKIRIPTTPPIILPPILNLPTKIIEIIIQSLDYPSTIFLKYSCKRMIKTLTSYPLSKATREDTLTIRKIFPSKTNFTGSRSPSYWCHRCSEDHSFEHLVIWPHPRPESHFQNFKEFSEQTPRVCVPWAIQKGIWSPGGKMGQNNKYTLCEKCLTPRKISNGKCSWNCQRCECCARRKIWSGFCVGCWKPGDGKVLRGKVQGGSGGYEGEKREEKERICGMCLGRLAYSVGSTELCRCNETRHNSSDYRGW